MGLTASQRRTLESIERQLRAREPKLAAMFSIFARLTQDELLPGIEAIKRRPWQWLTARNSQVGRILGAAFVPFVLIAFVSIVLVIADAGSPSGQCAPIGFHYSARLTTFPSSDCALRSPPPGLRRRS